MKTIIQNKQPKAEYVSGKLYISVTDLVVLCTKNYEGSSFDGVVVVSNQIHCVGHHSHSWSKESFMPFIGEIILIEE
ncbi:MAG: hypothetical protein ACOH2V_00385 [Candidatus Saccharimonadaceae bacterium]